MPNFFLSQNSFDTSITPPPLMLPRLVRTINLSQNPQLELNRIHLEYTRSLLNSSENLGILSSTLADKAHSTLNYIVLDYQYSNDFIDRCNQVIDSIISLLLEDAPKTCRTVKNDRFDKGSGPENGAIAIF